MLRYAYFMSDKKCVGEIGFGRWPQKVCVGKVGLGEFTKSPKSGNTPCESKVKTSTWHFQGFFSEKCARHVSGHVSVRFLCKIATFSGFAVILLTANSLCSPVRQENPASRACGKKKQTVFLGDLNGHGSERPLENDKKRMETIGK